MITYAHHRTITPAAIQTLRQSVGWDGESDEVWQLSLQQALAVHSAWDAEQLVGIVFLGGIVRTGIISDLTVHSDYQRQGIGRQLIRRTVEQARPDQNIFLFYHPGFNHLESFYRSLGFLAAPTGMMLHRQ